MPADRPDVDPGELGVSARSVSAYENWRFISFLGLPRWYAWASSAVFHALAATAIATVTFPSVAHVRTEQPKDVPTILKIGEKLYFVAKIQPAPRRTANAPATRKAPPAPAPQPAKAEVRAPAPPAPPARTEVRRNQVSEATVIQPLSPPDLVFPAVQPLPSFEVQATQRIRTPKPFVVPGRPSPKPVVETAALPPPPQQPDLTRVAPVTFAPRSTLVLPPGPPPVMDARPPDLKTTVDPVARVGDPISILSLSDVAVPPKSEIVVPPGNVLGRTGDGIVIVAGNNVSGGAVVGGEASAADRGAASGPARPGVEGALPTSPRPPAGTPGAAAGGQPGASPAPAPLKPNQMRRPNDGQFDAVVVQNTPTDQFPESRGLLTGRPIYSVYISVGTAKDWTLYFAVPNSAPAQQQTGTRVVEITTVTPVLAPYPVLLERPNTTIPAFFKYVLVYGTVNEAGRFQNLRVVRPTRPEADKALLAALANWEFRPASREGKKLGVEVLLYVPVDGL